MKEDDIRRHVRKQRLFYTQAVELGVLNLVLIVAWLLFDLGHQFWPKYVLFFSFLGLAIKGYQYGFFPILSNKIHKAFNKLHFMSEEWEEEKVAELIGKRTSSPTASPTSHAESESPRKPATKPSTHKATQKKIVGRTTKPS